MSDRFYMPVKVQCGRDAVAENASAIAALGKKALVVSGHHSAKACGVYDDLCRALEEEGISHVLFDQVEENPSVDTVLRGRDLALDAGADFVIGAGGGSPLDAAKSIALMARHPAKGEDFLYDPKAEDTHLPLVLIPTTCGTGSEVTAVSILTSKKTQIKKSTPHRVFAELALLDGKYLRKLPQQVLCSTAFDALSHLYESYINTQASPISRMIAEDGLRAWRQNLPVLLGERQADEQDLDALLRASMLGGMAIAHTGTGLPHGLSYALTTKLGIPHGKAVNFFTAGYLKEADEADRCRVLEISGFSDLEAFSGVYEQCCGALGVEEQALVSVLEQAAAELAADSVRCKKAPFPVDEAVVKRIAFDGCDRGTKS